MASRGSDLLPVVQKSYDLCAGLYAHVNRFPARSGVSWGVSSYALAMLVSLTVANRRTERAEALREASGRLDALRITLRLGKHLGFVSNGGYAQLSKGADEVGRMLGGWLKYEQGEAVGTTGRPPSAVARDWQEAHGRAPLHDAEPDGRALSQAQAGAPADLDSALTLVS